MTHQGSCHCGQIEFEVDGEPEQLIQCNCSHCDRKGYLLWFVGRDQLRLLTAEADLATYTFNKHAIQHHFCPTCGCAPFGRGEAPGSGAPMAAINVRCLPAGTGPFRGRGQAGGRSQLLKRKTPGRHDGRPGVQVVAMPYCGVTPRL